MYEKSILFGKIFPRKCYILKFFGLQDFATTRSGENQPATPSQREIGIYNSFGIKIQLDGKSNTLFGFSMIDETRAGFRSESRCMRAVVDHNSYHLKLLSQSSQSLLQGMKSKTNRSLGCQYTILHDNDTEAVETKHRHLLTWLRQSFNKTSCFYKQDVAIGSVRLQVLLLFQI